MNKRGFTLVELLGSIVILAMLALIAFPAILSTLNSGQENIDTSVKDFIVAAAEECVNDNIDNYNDMCNSVEKLKDNGYISTTFYDKYPSLQSSQIQINKVNDNFSYKLN